MTYSVRNIVIALVLAAVAAVLVIMYTGSIKHQADKSQSTVTVLVAKQDIPAGTKVSDAIAEGAFGTQAVVTKDEIPGALTSVKSLNKSLAASAPIAAGSQVTGAMFAPSHQNAISDQISTVDRGYEVALYPTMVLGGTLAAGDHVDVVWQTTLQPTNSNSKFGANDVSRVILTDVPVLSTSTSGVAETALANGGNTGGSSDGTTGDGVILSIPQSQLATLLLAQQTGKIWFAIRPSSGAQDSAPTVATGCSVITAGLTKAQVQFYVPECIAKG
jgi:pilus assembly protein CpaB